MKRLVVGMALAALALPSQVQASQAYGSLNNFDVVNDTGEPCHGFEIELEDVHSRDITYTYDWNHYGTPIITEDDSDPLHPRVRVRYQAKPLPEGGWSAYTAVPAGPVAPTDGHQFIDPTVNFGGEHFGVGFYGAPTTVRYFWLRDDGFGNLVRGNLVDIATPNYVYVPPVAGGAGQLQAVIQPPDPPEVHPLEFGEATWVKVTRTQTHSNNRVELRDLVSDDPEDPDDRNWRNDEPDEVEVEWQLLQTEFNQVDGGNNGVIESEPDEISDGDEVITRRYDFFKYSGPLDPESGEALCDNVAEDGVHGVGSEETEQGVIDFSTIEVVGDYIGAQMAGFDAGEQIGLIDHLQDGELNVPYVERTLVIAGAPPVVSTRTGELPQGMGFDEVTGLLWGTPEVAGRFSFTIESVDGVGAEVSKTYELVIKDGFEGEGVVEGTLEGIVEGVLEGSPEGIVEGVVEGVVEGIVEGSPEGAPEGVVEGSVEGVVEGTVEGSIEGSVEGSVEGVLEGEGSIEGVLEGAVEGEGSVEGSLEGSLEGEVEEGEVEEGEVEEGEVEEGEVEEGEVEEGEVEEGEQEDEVHQLLEAFDELDDSDDDRIEYEEAQLLLPTLTPEQFATLDTNNDGELNVAELLAAAGGNQVIHGGDTDGDRIVELAELLRIIQLYNARGYICLEHPGDSEDGYAPGEDDTAVCVLPHAADYDGGAPDGVIDLSELLRVIQFFSTGGYNYCPQGGTEDGFCAGPLV